jgi:hypothetical protein
VHNVHHPAERVLEGLLVQPARHELPAAHAPRHADGGVAESTGCHLDSSWSLGWIGGTGSSLPDLGDEDRLIQIARPVVEVMRCLLKVMDIGLALGPTVGEIEKAGATLTVGTIHDGESLPHARHGSADDDLVGHGPVGHGEQGPAIGAVLPRALTVTVT